MCGMADVATARRVGSVGQMAIDEGEKAIQALEWGARFWDPRSLNSVGSGVDADPSGVMIE